MIFRKQNRPVLAHWTVLDDLLLQIAPQGLIQYKHMQQYCIRSRSILQGVYFLYSFLYFERMGGIYAEETETPPAVRICPAPGI